MRKPIYIPKPSHRSFWTALAEFLTLMLMWGSIVAVAVFFRALVEG